MRKDVLVFSKKEKGYMKGFIIGLNLFSFITKTKFKYKGVSSYYMNQYHVVEISTTKKTIIPLENWELVINKYFGKGAFFNPVIEVK